MIVGNLEQDFQGLLVALHAPVDHHAAGPNPLTLWSLSGRDLSGVIKQVDILAQGKERQTHGDGDAGNHK